MTEFRTKTGRVLTDADFEALVVQAAGGYDVSHLPTTERWYTALAGYNAYSPVTWARACDTSMALSAARRQKVADKEREFEARHDATVYAIKLWAWRLIILAGVIGVVGGSVATLLVALGVHLHV